MAMKLLLGAIIISMLMSAMAKDVISLDHISFDLYVDGNSNVMLKFFAPWCGPCRQMAPEFAMAAASFDKSDDITFVELDCSVDANRYITAIYAVKSYPQIRYAPKGSTGYEFFNSEMSSEALVAFVNDKIGSNRTSALVVSVDNIITSVGGPTGYDGDFLMRLEKETSKHPYHPSMEIYRDLGSRVVEGGSAFVGEERRKLDDLINSAEIGFHQKRELITRRNILHKFIVNEGIVADL